MGREPPSVPAVTVNTRDPLRPTKPEAAKNHDRKKVVLPLRTATGKERATETHACSPARTDPLCPGGE